MSGPKIGKHIHALIMAGGGGERFWPCSRQASPKQLLKIFGARTMLQETAYRVSPLVPRDRLLIITTKAQAPQIRRQLPGVPRQSVVAEPFGRDTAACIALGAALIMDRDPEAIMIVLPADHVIKDRKKFIVNLRDACRVAKERNCLVTFGITPTGPVTGYGYIRRGRWLPSGLATAFARVEEFTEKPDRATAARYLRRGDYLWNSGIFVWKAAVIVEEFKKQMPDLYRCYLEIMRALRMPRWERVLARLYGRLKKISIDYGVMERAENVMMAQADFDWDDAGSWLAIERHFAADGNGNIVMGDNITLNSSGCIVMSDGGIVGCLGLKDTIVIRTPDAVLVCHRNAAQDIKKIVQQLRTRSKWKGYL